MKAVDYNALSQRERVVVREAYCVEQKWKCWFCKTSLGGLAHERVVRAKIDIKLFPRGFMKYPIHLHHSHRTGMTIGAVHCRCNAYLWQYHSK